jgi:hypothetical protein
MPKSRRSELAVGAGGGQLAEPELVDVAPGPWPGWPHDARGGDLRRAWGDASGPRSAVLPLSVLHTRLAGRHDAARRELLARLVERLGREGIALASSAG